MRAALLGAVLLAAGNHSAAREFDPARIEPFLDRGTADQLAPKFASREFKPPADIDAIRRVWGNAAQRDRIAGSPLPPGAAVRFSVVGDSEPGRFFWERWWSPGKSVFRDHLRAIQGRGADLIVHLGDFVSEGTEDNVRAHAAELEAEARLPLVRVIGNHDRSRPNGAADKDWFRAAFGPETDWYFDRGGWRFVGLDSSDTRLTGAQLAWLDQMLDTPLRKIVFMHIPPAYLKGKLVSPGLPKSALEDDPEKYRAYFTPGSGALREILSRRGVARVYFGHIHAFATAFVDGVGYVLTGGGGSPLYPLPPGYPTAKMAHVIDVEAGPDGLRETVRLLDGRSFPLEFTGPASPLRDGR